MKKLCISLLLFCLQTSLLISCSPETKSPEKVDPNIHMAALAAIISLPTSSNHSIRRLHKKALGGLISDLIRENNESCHFTLPARIPGYRPADSSMFCIFAIPHTTTEIFSPEEYSIMLEETLRAKPTRRYVTSTMHHDDHDEIVTMFRETDTQHRVIIPCLKAKSENLKIFIDPSTESSMTYDISSKKIQDASEKSYAQYVNIKSITSKSGPLEKPIPAFPNHTFFALRTKQPESHDDTKHMVTIWANPKKTALQ